MNELLTINATILKHYAIISFWVALILAIFRAARSAFGPIVRKWSPKAADFFAACFQFLSTVGNDVLGAFVSGSAPPGGSTKGFARASLLRALAVMVLVGFAACTAALAMHGCGGSQLSHEAQVANAIGVAGNASEPIWIGVYRAEGKRAADVACAFAPSMSPDCIARRVAAVAPVEARWTHVRDAWRVLRHAHAAYADALDACQLATEDGGICPPLTAAGAAFDQGVIAYRCAVRAIGESQLDPLPPPAPTCGSEAP